MSSTTLDRSSQRYYIDEFIKRYVEHTITSKKYAQTYRPILVDKTALGLSFSPELKELCYPIVAQRYAGSRLWDIDGNEYVDILMGLGINLLGHNPTCVADAVTTQLEKGFSISPQAELAGEVAQLIAELTGVERVTFSNTGTEAIMTAIRIARAATRRNKIVVFTNSYHGHSDQTLVRATLSEYAKKAVNRQLNRVTANWLAPVLNPLRSRLSAINPKAVPAAIGIPATVAENVLVLEYGNPASLDIIRAHRRELAAVLVEPVQSRCPQLQPQEFLQQLRHLTQTTGIALIFDEMVTGFRIHPGGAQAWFNVQADIVTYSKIVGGGLPLSVIAGKAAFLDYIDGGNWNYGDASVPQTKTTFFAGTFCKHPLSLAAAKAMLLHLKTAGPELQSCLNQRTAELVSRLNASMKTDDIPMQFIHFGSFFAVDGSVSRMTEMATALMSYHLLWRGVHLRQGDKGGFLSTAHVDADLDFIQQAFRDSANELREAGFFS
jgi:glutamate-1-semialdehyde aminotransferase